MHITKDEYWLEKLTKKGDFSEKEKKIRTHMNKDTTTTSADE